MNLFKIASAFAAMFASNALAEVRPAEPAAGYIRDLLNRFDKYLDDSAIKDRLEERSRARIVPKGAKPEVSIRRTGVEPRGYPYFADGILFNGQRITLNDPPSRGPEVFGSEFRIYQSYYVWDKLGIAMHIETPSYGPRAKKDVINNISIHLNPTDEGPKKKPMNPIQNFTGYLELDGAGIDRDTKIWEIRALVDRTGLAGAHAYLTCNNKRPVCDIFSYGKERSDEVYFWTDKDHANGKIYTVNYTFKP